MDSFPSSPPAPVSADLATLRASLDLSGIPPQDARPQRPDRNVERPRLRQGAGRNERR